MDTGLGVCAVAKLFSYIVLAAATLPRVPSVKIVRLWLGKRKVHPLLLQPGVECGTLEAELALQKNRLPKWINYNHLYYFWVVAREGSMVRAAEELLVSQPTISCQIKELEEMFGKKLFD